MNYYKNFGVADEMKWRLDSSLGEDQGIETVLLDYSTKTAYMWDQPLAEWFDEDPLYVEHNLNHTKDTARRIDFSLYSNLLNPWVNADQIVPKFVGQDTWQGHPCDKWQWTVQLAGGDALTYTVTVWKDKSFPVALHSTSLSGYDYNTAYSNIVFETLPDSLFEIPAGVPIK